MSTTSASPPSSPRIVIADGRTTNPGDLDWGPLESLGTLVVHDRSGPLLVERCRDADIVLTNKERLSASVFAALPRLRFVSVLATGTNVVDLSEAARRGIPVSNVPGYSTASVAQHVFALVLDLNNQVAANATVASDGTWSRSGDFSYRTGPIFELAGKTLGIVGLGAIGRSVAKIGAALGMRIAAAPQRSMACVAIPGVEVEWLELPQLFARSDVLTLHCPLTTETRHLVNAERLSLMQPGALLINTGRGDLIEEAALDAALRAGRLRGAGLDVLSQEPPAPDHPLLHAPGCRITPHLAWASVEARQRLIQVSADNVRAFLASKPQNLVTP